MKYVLPHSRSSAKEEAADTNHIASLFNGNAVVAAHAHGQFLKVKIMGSDVRVLVV